MPKQQIVLSAAQMRERLRNGYRDTLEGLPDYAARDWRVRLIGWIAAVLFSRGTAYRMVLHGSLSEIIKRDLAKFCFAARPTYVAGSQSRTLINEGRRQVWLKIQWYLNVEEKQISDWVEEDEF